MITHEVTTALCAGLMATVVVGGAALTPTAAQAAKTSIDERFVLKETAAACKAEAKEKKIGWPASRKYVEKCITTALKEHPTMNIGELHRVVNVKTLPAQQRPEWGCDVITSGRATGC